jgi:hypothetical protein
LGSGLNSDGGPGNGIRCNLSRDNHSRFGCEFLRLRGRFGLLQLYSKNLFKSIKETIHFRAFLLGRRRDTAKSKANATQCLVEGHAQCRKYRIGHNWSLRGSAHVFC